MGKTATPKKATQGQALTFDRRLVNRFLRQGKLTKKQLEEYVSQLPDAATNIVVTQSGSERGEARASSKEKDEK